MSWSSDYQLVEGKNERLVSLCQQAGATKFLLGPAAQVYLDETDRFLTLYKAGLAGHTYLFKPMLE
jgi:hypothetical protein